MNQLVRRLLGAAFAISVTVLAAGAPTQAQSRCDEAFMSAQLTRFLQTVDGSVTGQASMIGKKGIFTVLMASWTNTSTSHELHRMVENFNLRYRTYCGFDDYSVVFVR